MPFVDLIWTGMAAIGGLLLVDSLPNVKGKVGVWLIFFAFIFQTYWEITHPWNHYSLILVIYVSFFAIFGVIMVLLSSLFKQKPK
jgi:hypothetical protein